MVALYGPRTTVFVTLDDGVYEFTCDAHASLESSVARAHVDARKCGGLAAAF